MMLMILAGLIGGLGLVCIMSRRTLLGALIGIQLLVTGASMMFVSAGISSGISGGAQVVDQLADHLADHLAEKTNGHVGALFIVLAGLIQLSTGFALLVRLFYLKGRAEMSDLRKLRH